jgi:hypothetical protein
MLSYGQDEQNDKTQPNWKLPKFTLTGYTGDVKRRNAEDDDVPVRNRRYIRGYTGFIPGAKAIYGKPIIPSDEQQRINNEMLMGTYSPPQTESFVDKYMELDDCGKFLKSMRRTSLLERYDDATRELFRREQSPEMLVKLVQSKIAERVSNYAEQLKFVKLEFQQYKVNPEVGFNEGALREVLMRMNIHLDDVQSLALFAFFDIDGVG